MEKQEQMETLWATIQANLINPHVKKNVKPSDFMSSKKGEHVFSSKEDMKIHLERQKQLADLRDPEK